MDHDGIQNETAAAFADYVLVRELLDRLRRIETTLDQLISQQKTKDWYTTDEVARVLGKAPFTVREWCRNHRIHASKRDCGRGNAQEWIIAHEELQRIRNEGLLPGPEYRHYR